MKTASKPAKKHVRNRRSKNIAEEPAKIPFIEHLYELRRRLFVVALAVLAGAVLAFQFRTQLTDILVWPADGQQFIFTSPAGGFEFIFRLCLYAGVIVAIPIIVFQLLRYLQPIMGRGSERMIGLTAAVSGILAVIGMSFAYFFGLPSALRFLLQNFSSDQIEALLTIQAYMSFVTAYMLGAALIFQVPLIMLIINKINRLKPGKLFAQQRWFVVIAFIFSAIISPTHDIPNLLILALPMIGMYYLGIMLVWLTNRKHNKPHHVQQLREADLQRSAERLQQFRQAQHKLKQTGVPTPQTLQTAIRPEPQTKHSAITDIDASRQKTPPIRTRQQRVYVDNFSRRSQQKATLSRRYV